MHEYSIVQALLSQVEESAQDHGALAVHRLHLTVGELSGVEVELLQFAWEAFRERTLCAGAPLEIERVAAKWACPDCGRGIEAGAVLSCPDCLLPARLEQGDEIVLQRIEMEVA